MKINWGTGIVIAFVIFASLLTVAMVLGARQRVDLVTPEYYEEEIRFQDKINHRENAKEIGGIDITVEKNALKITFPKALQPENTNGLIKFYKPDNAIVDFETALTLSADNSIVIDTEKRIGGLWKLMIEAEQNGTVYYWEESIRL